MEGVEVLKSRRRYLQSFFDELVRHKAVMCYDLTQTFLKEISPVKLEAALSSEADKKGPLSVKDMTHFDGIVSHEK